MEERTRELLTLIAGDVAIFISALWITLLVRYLGLPSTELLQQHLGPFLIISTIWIFVFYIAGLYDKHTIFLKSMLFSRIVRTQLVNIVLAFGLFLIIPFGITPKTNLVIYLIISVILITMWRMWLFPRLAPKESHKAILLADGPEAVELVDEVNNNDRYTYRFVRIIDQKTATQTDNFAERLLALIEKEKVDIVVADPHAPHTRHVLPEIFKLSFLSFKITFFDFYKVYEATFDRIPLTVLHYEWFITHISQARDLVYDTFKRGVDILGAIVLSVPAMILFPFVALAIRLEDKGPLFYTSERIGQYNARIKIYKLRTKNGADTDSAALKSQLVDTKVGRILRKTRIDELPQLINVLRGDLSFIGPRPEMPALAEVYAKEIPYYNTRHLIKPGLSGWAQIKEHNVPRGGVDVERTKTKLSYDLWYLQHRSLLLDIQIAFKTFCTLFMRSGT